MDFAKNNVTVKVTWHEIASLYIIAHQIQSNMNYDWRLEVLIIGKLSGRVNTLAIAA
jgi:predicted nucleotide-binding protein